MIGSALSLSLWQGVVVAFLLGFALLGSWSVLWWLCAFPTRPTEIVTWDGGRRVTSPVTYAYSATSMEAFSFEPGARWLVQHPDQIRVVSGC